MRFPRFDSATRITLLYISVAGLWMLLSDRILKAIAPDIRWLMEAEIIKGLTFVMVTAVLLYYERRRADRGTGFLAAIVESASDAIIGATVDGVVTSWNNGAENVYGYSADEVHGHSIAMFMPPERRDDVPMILNSIRSGKSIYNHETIRLRKDGSCVPISLTVSPVRDITGKITGMSSIARNISEWNRAKKAVQMAEVGQLASGLVHEIRNPLNAMRMQIAVINDSLENPGTEDLELARNQLGHLESEVLRVQKLANDFLAFGRPARDKPVDIQLHEMVTDVADFVQSEFAKVGATVEVESDSTTKSVTVFMDRDKLRQILINLAENARQAVTTGGKLIITCDRPVPNRARIRMKDDGCGMPADRLPNIFNAFYSTKDEGTGLGLAIVKQTVESAGGNIRAESEPGSGTCIEIELPIAKPDGMTEDNNRS